MPNPTVGQKLFLQCLWAPPEETRALWKQIECLTPDQLPAQQYRLRSLLHAPLSTVFSISELPLLQDMAQDRQEAIEANQRMIAQYGEARRALDAAGVSHFPLKGMDLLHRFSDQTRARAMGDVDILVPPRGREIGLRALIQLGYRYLDPIAEEFADLLKERTLQRGQERYLDYHFSALDWDLSPKRLEKAWELLEKDKQKIAGVELMPLGACFFYTCLHGYADFVERERIAWVYDAFLCLKQMQQPTHWDLCFSLAELHRVELLFFQSMQLLGEFGVPHLPPWPGNPPRRNRFARIQMQTLQAGRKRDRALLNRVCGLWRRYQLALWAGGENAWSLSPWRYLRFVLHRPVVEFLMRWNLAAVLVVSSMGWGAACGPKPEKYTIEGLTAYSSPAGSEPACPEETKPKNEFYTYDAPAPEPKRPQELSIFEDSDQILEARSNESLFELRDSTPEVEAFTPRRDPEPEAEVEEEEEKDRVSSRVKQILQRTRKNH